ncbi:tetratricopeptide repeat protein [Streptosporangium saharense]|uniref:Flp pilus assembly protein TadD n=1 Tax=Streptosporangium saharense TaxID=1706840 RepID=A0A7W7QN77_9ACTN|nr:tetratricopeptide repeat protein [Streptosporangium saharense]MBB4916687.1 Flp pilus assembly protein TadD [Streptosporangium saharense]
MNPGALRPGRPGEGTDLPYVGLRAFRREEGAKFFGRARESHEVSDLWQANRLTILYGPSGVGKTSLIQAGVLPLLDPNKTDILPIGRVSHGSAFPSAALSRHNPHVFALLSSWSPEETPTRLAGLTLHEFLRRRPARQDPYGDPVLTLAAIDQAEELFGGFPHRGPYREWFIGQLAQALDDDPNLRLLISIREDYLAAILPHEPELAGLGRGRFPLGALDTAAAVRATEGPLEGTGRSFAPGAARFLVDDLRVIRVGRVLGEEIVADAKKVEPVQLQVVCSALWHSLPDDVRVISLDHVRRFADADRSLGGFSERMIAEVARDHLGGDTAGLRSWLRRTFVTELGTREVVYQGETLTAGMPNAVVRALVERHILREDVRAGTRWCELSHERLIQPILRGGDPGGGAEGDAVPAAPQDYLRAAEISLRDGEFGAAARQAEEALLRCGDDTRLRAEIESFLGNVAHERDDVDRAVAHYRTAAVLFETLGASAAVGRLLAGIGRLRLLQGRPGDAVRELYSAVSRVPGDMGVQTELAWALWYDGHPDAARDVLDEVLSREGNLTEALRARGEILADLGRAEEALRDLGGVRPLQWPSTRAAHALALASVGRLAEAEREITAVLAEAGDHGPALLYAARVRALTGDRASAAGLARLAGHAVAPALPAHMRQEAGRLAGGA